MIEKIVTVLAIIIPFLFKSKNQRILEAEQEVGDAIRKLEQPSSDPSGVESILNK